MYSKPRKRLRTVYSEAQVRLLEATYEEQKYPESSKRRWLAAKTGIPIDRLQVWFQNRRARDRRLKDERIVKNMEKGRENMAYISQVSVLSSSTMLIVWYVNGHLLHVEEYL